MSQERLELANLLLRHAVAGTLPAEQVLPVVEALTGGAAAPLSRTDLLARLQAQEDPVVAALRQVLAEQVRQDAARAHSRGKDRDARPAGLAADLGSVASQAPLGWHRLPQALAHLQRSLVTLDDRLFLQRRAALAPTALRDLQEEEQRALAPLHGAAAYASMMPVEDVLARALDLVAGDARDTVRALVGAIRERHLADVEMALGEHPLPPLQDERGALSVLDRRLRAASGSARSALLDAALTWPTDAILPVLLEHVTAPAEQERADWVLTLRFGPRHSPGWAAWQAWLGTEHRRRQAHEREVAELVSQRPLELLWCWSARPGTPQELRQPLEAALLAAPETVTVDAFFSRWMGALPAGEVRALRLGRPAPAAPEVPPAPVELPLPQPRPVERRPTPARPVPAMAPAAPAVVPAWRRHIGEFVAENWYLVLGLAMVVVGSSLLSYFTWDRGWFFRYTLTPLLLGLFTASLARLGGWLEARDAELKTTGALLRGAAVSLVPLNFMAVGLLSADPDVPLRAVLAPAMALAYVAIFALPLTRWCAAIHPGLRWRLGGPLLVLNALAVLVPLGHAASAAGPAAVVATLAAGFYLGFMVVVRAAWSLAGPDAPGELSADRRALAFAGSVLLITAAQVFLWVHGFLRVLPPAAVYALLAIFSGSLVLYLERRFLEQLRARSHADEVSFLGYALLFLGVLMGITHPAMRVVTLGAAGAAWLWQARFRRQPVHYAVALLLLSLSGASISLLDFFPLPFLPALGLVLAFAVLALGLLGLSAEQAELRTAATGFHLGILLVDVPVAMVTQWHFHTPPVLTGLLLLLVSALFLLRGVVDRSLRWVHTAVFLAPFALPYLGCMDVQEATLDGNTLSLGLGVLCFTWVLLLESWNSPLPRAARSTALVLWGVLAATVEIAGLFLDIPPPPSLVQVVLTDAGPVLVALALVAATYFTRSWVPAAVGGVLAGLASVELRGDLQSVYPALFSRSGLGSGMGALVLVLLAFWARELKALRNLEGGDLWLGEEEFPLRRTDHSLFTWPALGVAVFLAGKVGTVNLVTNFWTGPFSTVAALYLAGVSLTLLAVFVRREAWAWLPFHLGWLYGLAAILLAFLPRVGLAGVQWPLLVALAVGLALQVGYRHGLAPRHPWAEELLAAPMDRVVQFGTLAVAWVGLAALVTVYPLDGMVALLSAAAVLLAWNGLRTGDEHHGVTLFAVVLVGLLSASVHGRTPLFEEMAMGASLPPVLVLVLAVQAILLVLERSRRTHRKLRALLRPFQWGTTAVTIVLGVGALVLLAASPSPDVPLVAQQAVVGALALAVLLVGRSHGNGALLLVALLLGYQALHLGSLQGLRDATDRLQRLVLPWHLAALALAAAVAGHLVKRAVDRRPRLVKGPFGVPFLRSRAWPWLFSFAVLAVLVSVTGQTVDVLLRPSAENLLAAYVGTLALLVVGWSAGRVSLHVLALWVMAVGNVHVVRFFSGEVARRHGVSSVHLVAVGLGVTLLLGTALHRTARDPKLTRGARLSALQMAGLIIVLLAAHYFVHPDVPGMSEWRFLVAGGMAYLAGLYFRRSALRALEAEDPLAPWLQGAYHLGLCMALWCLALMVPWLRQPHTALLALSVPQLYFYARAELGERDEDGELTPRTQGYVHAASLLGFVLLGLYVLRVAFHYLMFPELPTTWQLYHDNAWVMLPLSVVMLRLHGLGGSWWLAFYGGLSLAGSAFFLVTSLPGLSPFTDPVHAGLVAVGLAHFFLALAVQDSPLRAGLQRLTGLDDDGWWRLVVPLGVCLLVGLHVTTAVGLADADRLPHLAAPLLLATASVLFHHAVVNRNRWTFLLATAELVLALHADFLVPSYLPKTLVIWALLGLWLVAVALHAVLRSRFRVNQVGLLLFNLFVICMLHVAWHGPASRTGLWAVVFMVFLGAFSPHQGRPEEMERSDLPSVLLLLAPVWLVFFSQSGLLWSAGTLRPWPILLSAGMLLGVGWLAQRYQAHVQVNGPGSLATAPTLLAQLLGALGVHGSRLLRGATWTVFVVVTVVRFSAAPAPWLGREVALYAVLYAALCWSFIREGHLRASMLPFFLAEACIEGVFGVARAQVAALHPGAWTLEYDVWAEILAVLALAGIKELLPLRKESLVPVVGSMLLLPVVALGWAFSNNADVDTYLLVMGVNSVVFAFMGREEKESPYNIVAVLGFVVFVVVALHGKLELRTLHAYVLPTGLGILVLVQLHGERLQTGVKANVRLVALLSMLGSAGFYALAAPRFPVAYHAAFVLLGLAAAGVGALLRVRLYVALGVLAVLVDLAALVARAVFMVERGTRMSVLGVFVLLLGAALVGGTALARAHKAAVQAQWERWRGRLADWE